MRNISVFGAFLATCIAVSAGRIFSPEDMAKENLRKLAFANNELAFNLHRRLASGSSKNVFFSPLSISTAFSMILYGARGETAEELRKTLGYEKVQLLGDLVHDTFSRFFSDVLKSGDSSDGYVLNSANSILVDKRLELLEEYRRNVQELYRATVRNVDFAREGPRLVEEINDWVKEKTNGKIQKLLQQLSPASALVLLNAVYFKGTWETQFDPKNTRDGVFYNNGLKSEAKNVPMMNLETELPMAFFNDFKALELPYKGGNVSMLILLPHKRDGLQALEESLTPEKLAEVQERIQPFEMPISLPKFKLEFETELSGPLQALGANQIFSAGADFSGMTPGRGVSISEVLHKAVIEVNEEGSEAAAVTGVVALSSLEFRVDHPFLFTIVEKGSRSNMVLFMGRVNNF
ncbi:Leukocyte elastase inhibitor C [Araneus ventricosus]|uniref:Leukocyte elastase inhibitor C n=1 Tax=Araneus ventricosus TaxID=182803 RepID=A0A4Y2HH60_ARAVE|nr:Leukocyte elastase inhibitor C [Araneus ventricosus]